uniref:Trichoplein keratin filament binding n=1 Tax=Sarcophilus harrisii TaxID=9305 RepID=A0A7N4NUW1_SARHA
MALPTIPSCWPARNRILERQIVRQREQEARFRQQWDVNSRYFKEFDVWSSKQAHWSSRMCYQQSMQAYEQQKLKEEKKRSLAERRKRLCKLLAEERTQLTKELKEKRLNVALRECEMRERSEKLKSAREQERKTVAEQLLYEHWKKTNPRFREIESALHRKHVVNSWESQLSERKQQETAEKEEKIRFENQYELARRLALERIKREEEEKRLEDKQQAEALLRQMEELKLKEMEATKLKKEQENLLRQQWELGLLEEERRSMEEYRKKAELGYVKGGHRASHVPLPPKARGSHLEFPPDAADAEVLSALCVSFRVQALFETPVQCAAEPTCPADSGGAGEGSLGSAARCLRGAEMGWVGKTLSPWCLEPEQRAPRGQRSEAPLDFPQEADKRILLALLEKEDEHQRQDSARREQAAADAAWMKQVIEDQLEVERVREAELQLLYREEAKQMWEKREAEWEKERQARDRLMKEVLTERQHQLQEKIELNRRAQEEALKYREQLIRGLEEAREETRRARAEEAELKTSRKQELEAQIAERHLQDREEYVKQRKEEEETRLADQLSEELVEQEARLMSERGFQSKPYGHPKVAWN